jgi:hypothetical protein
MKAALKLIIISLLTLIVINVNYSQNIDYPMMRFVLPPNYYFTPTDMINAIVSVGPFDNYILSNTPGFMETDVAVNRTNPLNFVATDNRVITGANYIFYTTNGGINWYYSTVPTSQGDPVFAADGQGNLYFAILNNGVRIHKSTNGGVSWGSAVTIVSNSYADKEWIACDQTTGTYKDNVYMAYFDATSGSQKVAFHRSTNNGVSWTGPNILAPTVTTNPGPNIIVDYTGKVYVFITTNTGAVVRISTDGGATFGATNTAAAYIEPGILNSTSGRYCVKGNIRTNGHPQAATTLAAGPYQGYTYICYAANPPGPDIANVYVVRTTNGGLNWSYPIQVNDDGTTTDQWMPDISVDDQGRVWVYWFDSRNDPSNILTELWGAVSTDGGATFSPNFKISSQNFDPNSVKEYQGPEHYYMGDYVGMSGKTFTFPVYPCQNNSRHDYHVYLPDFGVSFKKAVDSLNVNSTSVNKVYIPMMGNYSGTVTYTATVNPPPSQGTITFQWVPGNVKVLTGSPDSLTLNATTSSNVPYGTYTVNVTATESSGIRVHTRSYILVVANVVSKITENQESPRSYELFQNYPNPFNPATTIEFYLPKSEKITLKVYNIIGQEVARLIDNQTYASGLHSYGFDATNLPGGVYFYELKAGTYTFVRKMLLIK